MWLMKVFFIRYILWDCAVRLKIMMVSLHIISLRSMTGFPILKSWVPMQYISHLYLNLIRTDIIPVTIQQQIKDLEPMKILPTYALICTRKESRLFLMVYLTTQVVASGLFRTFLKTVRILLMLTGLQEQTLMATQTIMMVCGMKAGRAAMTS